MPYPKNPNAIYDTDVDALPRLREKLAKLEAERRLVADYNKAAKKGTADIHSLPPHLKSDLLMSLQYSAFQCPNGRFPAWVSQNLSGNITRIRKRIARLEA